MRRTGSAAIEAQCPALRSAETYQRLQPVSDPAARSVSDDPTDSALCRQRHDADRFPVSALRRGRRNLYQNRHFNRRLRLYGNHAGSDAFLFHAFLSLCDHSIRSPFSRFFVQGKTFCLCQLRKQGPLIFSGLQLNEYQKYFITKSRFSRSRRYRLRGSKLSFPTRGPASLSVFGRCAQDFSTKRFSNRHRYQSIGNRPGLFR